MTRIRQCEQYVRQRGKVLREPYGLQWQAHEMAKTLGKHAENRNNWGTSQHRLSIGLVERP